MRAPEAVAAEIRNAGAIFLGPHTPEAIGDYVGGSNHVLPTARSARFSSGLGVLDFMKRTSILKCGPEQLRALGPLAMTLGQAEGHPERAHRADQHVQVEEEGAELTERQVGVNHALSAEQQYGRETELG